MATQRGHIQAHWLQAQRQGSSWRTHHFSSSKELLPGLRMCQQVSDTMGQLFTALADEALAAPLTRRTAGTYLHDQATASEPPANFPVELERCAASEASRYQGIQSLLLDVAADAPPLCCFRRQALLGDECYGQLQQGIPPRQPACCVGRCPARGSMPANTGLDCLRSQRSKLVMGC